jgi:hypothetical protein
VRRVRPWFGSMPGPLEAAGPECVAIARIRVPAVIDDPILERFLDALVSVKLYLVQPAVAGGHGLGANGLQGGMRRNADTASGCRGSAPAEQLAGAESKRSLCKRCGSSWGKVPGAGRSTGHKDECGDNSGVRSNLQTVELVTATWLSQL